MLAFTSTKYDYMINMSKKIFYRYYYKPDLKIAAVFFFNSELSQSI